MFPTLLKVLGRYFDHLGLLEASFDLHNFIFDLQVNLVYSRLHIFLLSPVTSVLLSLIQLITSVSSLPFSCSVPALVLSGLERTFHHCLAGQRTCKKMQIWVTLKLCMRI